MPKDWRENIGLTGLNSHSDERLTITGGLSFKVWFLSSICSTTPPKPPKHKTENRSVMSKGQMLSAMISLATEKHAGQFDKGGRPYILHPLTVMHRLRTDDEELQCIAVGHDLIEDTDVSEQDLSRLGFSRRVVLGILDLTKRDGQTPEQYRERVKANPDAVRVKMEDLRHNSDIRRLKGVTEKDVQRITRYHQFYLELRATHPASA